MSVSRIMAVTTELMHYEREGLSLILNVPERVS